MKTACVALGVVMLAGCSPSSSEPVKLLSEANSVRPCLVAKFVTTKDNAQTTRVPTGELGYQHLKGGVEVTHCLPCEKAASSFEKFVCEGDK